jgi:hypothetical protein
MLARELQLKKISSMSAVSNSLTRKSGLRPEVGIEATPLAR